MLVLARESRSLTQKQVAAAMRELDGPGTKVSQAYVSRAETGQLAVTAERLELYAHALDYPIELLCLSEQEFGAGAGLIHHRRKQAASAGDLRRIHALLNLTRVQLRALLPGAPRPTGAGIPQIAVDDHTTPADAARWLRREWAVPAGPLESMVALVENAGALVAARELVPPAPLDSGASSVPVDAVSCTPPREEPLVLLNVGTPAERQRFTLAHELGHMVMHQVPHPDQEKQANSFAAELLMPARDIRPDLASGPVTLPRLLELKKHWTVSMWALLRRAHTLGVLSDWQYRSLAVEMSSLGYRTAEPGELDIETPTVVTSLITWHLEHGRQIADLARVALLTPHEFVDLYLTRPVAAGTGTTPSTVREENR
jgi:Zn-dependent peptidase ImmA (M78 family)/transcriptional regulator with XRE-family HTH domain